MRSFILFLVGGLAFGTGTLGLGYWLGGQDAIIAGGAGFALAFIPAVATLAWVLHSYRMNPEMQLLACLGSSGVRMGIAFGGGLLLTRTQSATFDVTLWYWLLLYYLAFLAFEITLVVWQQPKATNAPQA